MVTKGPFMEYLRAINLIDAQTVTTTTIRTPASKTEKLALLIHQIQFELPDPEFDAGVTNVYEAAVTDRVHTGDAVVPHLNSTGVMAIRQMISEEGIVVGAFGKQEKGNDIVYFDPPVLYARDAIYFECRKNLAGLTAANAYVSIGYTLDKVPDADFISALVD